MEDNNKTAEGQKIIIDLTESMNSRSFEESNIIHKAEFKKVIALINDKIKNVRELKDENCDGQNRFNDTITILGSRGSGKTSFLMNILKNYENNNDVEVIELIDPTLIEEKGHIFLTLISLIQDKVENAIRRKECNPCCKDYQLRKCWENKLKKLAAGLPSIDIDTGSPYSNWDDPEHVMKKGLNAVKAAKKLEENFDEIVKVALEILGKQAFLIAFDDIDVNFNNGWKVLETLRKYLTSPRIITLLSGDIKLFSKSIRKQQWINFGEEFLKNEGERLKKMEKYDELVTEIEGQYMQKIMKAPYRIHLLTIGEKINNSDIRIKILTKKNISDTESASEQNKPIYEYYNERLNALGLQNKYEVHTVNTYLLGLPLRTQIQLLKQFENIKNNGNKSLDILNITDSFISDMYESGVDVELAKSQPKDFCYIAHKFLLEKELLNETYQLLPTSGSVNYNAVLFSLFIMFVAHSKSNPSMFFEYWITIATIKNLLTIMPYRSEQKKDTTIVPTIEGLAEYSFIGQNKVYRDICSYLSTYLRATLNYNRGSETRSPWGGILILKGLADKAKGDSKEMECRIDYIFREETSIKKQLAFIPLSIASFAHKQQSVVIYSFYTLLGTIAELLRRYDVIKMNVRGETEEEKKKQIIYNIATSLNELSQVKDVVMPAFGKMTTNIDDEIGDNYIGKDVANENNTLAYVLYEWIEKCPDCVPSHLIGKIATRTFYAMRRLDDNRTSDYLSLGDEMHRRIIIVMNSALLEDAKEYLSICDLTNNNPIEKDNIFIENLNKINLYSGDTTNLIFSQWLLSCPLLLLYLNPGYEDLNTQCELNDLWQNLNDFSIYQTYTKKESEISDNNRLIDVVWFRKHSVYENIKPVSIFGIKKKDVSTSNDLNNFSLTKKNIEKTVNLTKSIYNQPEIYLNDDVTTIKDKLKTIFKESELTEKNIRKLQEYCEGCKTWDEVIDKVIGNK